MRSAARECLTHIERGKRVVGVLRASLMFKLESRLVDDCLVDDRRFSELNALLAVLRVVRARRQRESANTHEARVLRVIVAGDKGVVGVDLVIDSGAERSTAAGDCYGFIKVDDIVIRVENRRHDQRLVVDVALVEVDEERSFSFRNWATEVAAVLSRLNWGTAVSKRVSGVKSVVVKVK